jgi:hypothetical protein
MEAWNYQEETLESVADLDEFYSDCQYMGFNPDTIVKRLKAIKKASNISNEDFYKDLNMMIMLVLSRGSIVANKGKFERKTSEKGVKQYKALKERYGIEEKSGAGLAPETITLLRVQAAYPQICAKLLITYPNLVTRFALSEGKPGSKLPYFLMFPGSNALIPEGTEARDELLQEYVEYQKNFTRVIQSKEELTAKDLETIQRFASLTQDTYKAATSETRVKMFEFLISKAIETEKLKPLPTGLLSVSEFVA